MNGNPSENHPLDQERAEKAPETCLGLTRQELIKTQRLTHTSIVFCVIYLILSIYLFSLYLISSLKANSPKLVNIDSKIIFRILIPIFAFNFLGKALTFYSSYTSSAATMRFAAFSQLAAIFLDIYLFLKVIGEGHRIESGFIYDDLLFVLFVYFCIIFDIIYLFSTIVLSIQLTIYGLIVKPKVQLMTGSSPIGSN